MSEEIKEILDWLKDYNRDRPFGTSIYDRKILSNYITNLQQKVEQLEKENKRLNNIINQADTKNLELIQKINKIYDVIENKSITGIEARLLIQDILDKENK